MRINENIEVGDTGIKISDIVSSGINYIKFGNGKLVCFDITDTTITGGHVTLNDGLYVSSIKQITFPIEFVNTPIVTPFISRNAGDINNVWCFTRSISKTGFIMWSARLTSSSGTGYYRGYVAIGDWK